MDMTILQSLLSRLPKEYVDCVVNNLQDMTVLHDTSLSLEVDLMNLFDWNDSREGYDFWDQVFQYIIGSSDLPELPIEIKYEPSMVIVADRNLYMMNTGATGLNISYELGWKEFHKAPTEIKEKILGWLN